MSRSNDRKHIVDVCVKIWSTMSIENMLWMNLLKFGGQCLVIMTENTLWIPSNDRKGIVEVCVKIWWNVQKY